MIIQNLIRVLHPFGDVLEVGFGVSSKEIQKYRPRSHTIIAEDPEAREWAKDRKGIQIIADIWQSALPALGVYDTIYFGIDPLEMGFLIRFQYTDTELEQFCSAVSEKKYLSPFLSELEQNGQITAEQKEKMIKKYGLTHEKAPSPKRSGEMLQFLKLCLATHMRKGSRFLCYLRSEMEDPKFFDEIAVDPFLDVRPVGFSFVIEKLAKD